MTDPLDGYKDNCPIGILRDRLRRSYDSYEITAEEAALRALVQEHEGLLRRLIEADAQVEGAEQEASRRLRERDEERAQIDAIRGALGFRVGEGLGLEDIVAKCRERDIKPSNPAPVGEDRSAMWLAEAGALWERWRDSEPDEEAAILAEADTLFEQLTGVARGQAMAAEARLRELRDAAQVPARLSHLLAVGYLTSLVDDAIAKEWVREAFVEAAAARAESLEIARERDAAREQAAAAERRCVELEAEVESAEYSARDACDERDADVAAARAEGMRDGLRRAWAEVLNAGIVTEPGQQPGVIFSVPMAERLFALATAPASPKAAPKPEPCEECGETLGEGPAGCPACVTVRADAWDGQGACPACGEDDWRDDGTCNGCGAIARGTEPPAAPPQPSGAEFHVQGEPRPETLAALLHVVRAAYPRRQGDDALGQTLGERRCFELGLSEGLRRARELQDPLDTEPPSVEVEGLARAAAPLQGGPGTFEEGRREGLLEAAAWLRRRGDGFRASRLEAYVAETQATPAAPKGPDLRAVAPPTVEGAREQGFADGFVECRRRVAALMGCEPIEVFEKLAAAPHGGPDPLDLDMVCDAAISLGERRAWVGTDVVCGYCSAHCPEGGTVVHHARCGVGLAKRLRAKLLVRAPHGGDAVSPW